MGIDLDRHSDIPLGVQLAWTLRARIAAGDLSPGDRLPGVRELAAAAGVNANTARTVYARLEADGLIHAEHGRGTFVAPGALADERLSAVARRALAEAEAAGLDPRDVAAALYAARRAATAAPPAGGGAGRRQALRDEIARLERELADARLARSLRERGPQGGMPAGGRLLSEDELRAQRDELVRRLEALREEHSAPVRSASSPEPTAASTPAPAPESTRSATRPGVRWRPVFGS